MLLGLATGLPKQAQVPGSLRERTFRKWRQERQRREQLRLERRQVQRLLTEELTPPSWPSSQRTFVQK